MKLPVKIHKGEMLRVTRWLPPGQPMIYFDPPGWAIATETDTVTAGVTVDWVIHPNESVCNIVDFHDRFTVVPIDEWPDEVCAAMATRALTN